MNLYKEKSKAIVYKINLKRKQYSENSNYLNDAIPK